MPNLSLPLYETTFRALSLCNFGYCRLRIFRLISNEENKNVPIQRREYKRKSWGCEDYGSIILKQNVSLDLMNIKRLLIFVFSDCNSI
jgi:hypothetical protein